MGRDLPRVCGDQPGYTFVLDYWCEFPPRVRGSTHADPRRWFCSQIYPACAGINLSDCPICGGRIHFPRVCGDQPREGAAFEQVSQFTPHARGSTQPQDQSSQCPAIYPACAGINLRFRRPYIRIADLPRMRGDQPDDFSLSLGRGLFTPHARGSTSAYCRLHDFQGFTPHARGST